MRSLQWHERIAGFRKRFQIAGRFVLVYLHLQPAVLIGQAVGFNAHRLQLPFISLRLDVFPNAKHQDGQGNAADLDPFADCGHIRTITHNLSKILIFALRDRGLFCVSSSEATITFRLIKVPQGTWPQMH